MMKSEFVIEQRKLEDNQSVEFGKRRRIQEAAGLLMNLTLIGDSVEGVAGLVKRASVRIWGVVDGLALVSKIDGLENIRLIILFFLKVPHRFRTRSTPAVAASTSRGFPGKMTLLRWLAVRKKIRVMEGERRNKRKPELRGSALVQGDRARRRMVAENSIM